MQQQKVNSVTTTIGRSMVTILFLVATTTSLALCMLVSSLNDAAAINTAGSLRMQSYRLAFDIETQSPLLNSHTIEFDQSLTSPTMQELHRWYTPQTIQHHYTELLLTWQAVRSELDQIDKDGYLIQVAPFVERIDQFVFELQQSSENKLHLLALISAVGLLLILMVVLFTIQFTQRQIVAPLNQLMAGCKQIKQHQFSLTINNKSKNELGILARTFTQMAADLNNFYYDLEQSVNEKTHRLRHANESLKVLYNCSQQLSVSRLTHHHFQQMLETLIAIDGLTAAKLIIEESNGTTTEITVGEEQSTTWHRQQLLIDGETMGQLWWQYQLPCPDLALIENIANILSRGIYYNRTQKQTEQLLLMEERATIARELHDSLAQSLSYLKIQLTLLKRQLTNTDNRQQQTIQTIDEELSNAYTQLRELLSTFRLTIKEANFSEALTQLLIPLREQTPAQFNIENHLPSMALIAHNQVHLLQIIREAVLNAIKHADAKQIKISCHQQHGIINVEIADDGVGFDPSNSKLNHYGLNIMQERASRLKGELTLYSQIGVGSQVKLQFALSEG
ncbi:nitrate/nitrite two-component system sensor histidine kinase NarQ [Photobacterium sp. NCIMB 13483]|uniref:Sensor protein n=1 Tax=Photobacterium piscicola TaxID=1378299 RepID=A0A1T5HZG8_9GAMM|nr:MULTISPECIES: nitrate/nitrite two-component system sensor histidine kinase NarQ [Photobacterium]MEC6821885.1 nitrate/nitrite two-component system sensor histidine kinase NarQ [Photobacterium piscicola]MEC6880775.1 nitrate/nitrite two-component system sensor histidine kinase NarQ [Photobacterium piscicola]MEC6897723.1 nitrate/nitrite two-component system sensor histidine kinase NarQ [Photobacterium piscicola]PST90056.1 nitrate/nitrite two-component system sensor histidine kinase NarQ [Photoba